MSSTDSTLTTTTDPATVELYRQELVREDVALFIRERELRRAVEAAETEDRTARVATMLQEVEAKRADVAGELGALSDSTTAPA